MKWALFLVATLISPAAVFAAPLKAPVLGVPKIISPKVIRWNFQNVDKRAVAFELWDVLARKILLRVDNPKARFIDETNVIPADPDMACGRYVVAVDAQGEKSFGQVMTYPCVRTPPVAPTRPVVEIVDKQIIKITASSGANDPATGIGIYEANRGNWVSPDNMFTATPELLTPGEWGADLGTLLIGLRPNSSYTFLTRARSVTGELSPWTAPTTLRMPAENGDAFAPSLASIGETSGLLGKTLLQTFITKREQPAIAGIFSGNAVTVTLDDRPYQAATSGTGAIKNFSFAPPAKIGAGYHYLRLGALRGGSVAWSPTIEFVVKK